MSNNPFKNVVITEDGWLQEKPMAAGRDDMPNRQKREEFDLVVKAMQKFNCNAHVNFETGQILTEEEYNQELYNPTGISLDGYVLVDDWIWDNIAEDDDGEEDEI